MSARIPRPLAALSLVFACFAPVPTALAGPAVTVYTQDLGYVRESRTFDLAGARDTVRLEGVSERLDFSSVRLAPADASARVLRLAYRYDVASGDGLIEKARGQRVSVTSRDSRVTEGTLIAADGSWLAMRSDDGSVTAVSRGAVETLRLAAPPASLATRPTIEAVFEGGKCGRNEAELSYLTGGLSWSAEHTLVRRGEGAGSWATNVTVDNSTGRDYLDATVKLVAGTPRRAGGMPPPIAAQMAMKTLAVSADGGAEMTEQAFADYHLYTLARPATLRDRETQAIVMHEARAVKFAPRYFYRGGDSRGVTTQIVIRNDGASGLGVALPAGRVRFYEPDASGALQFTGETTIGHTAEGEKLTLDVGQAFDLVAERRDLSNKRISDHEREYSVEIKLRNRKKTSVEIVVEENIGGDIEVVAKTHDFTRKDANTLQWTILVAAGKEVVMSYTARVRY